MTLELKKIFSALLISSALANLALAEKITSHSPQVETVNNKEKKPTLWEKFVGKKDNEPTKETKEATEDADESKVEVKTQQPEEKPEVTAPTAPKVVEEKITTQSHVSTQSEHSFLKCFADIAEQSLPAVVNIATTQIVDPKAQSNGESQRFSGSGNPLEELFRDFMVPHGHNEAPRKVQSLGSGFIIGATKDVMYIVTNHHVIAEAKKITVFLNDKTEVDAQLHGSDERTDIAVLKIKISSLSDKNKKIKPLEWANAEEARIGEWVIAIGNPFGLGSSVTNGIISSKGRDLLTPGRGKANSYVDDYIQHSAQINMGNSGGCLLDMNGRVLGVNTAILSPSGGNVGVGFATPAGVAKRTVDQLIQFGRTKRGWLGVRVQHLTEEALSSLGLKGQGDIVMDLTPGGPAEKGGMKAGDIVFEFNGKTINEQNRITRLVGESEINSTVVVKVYRKGEGNVTLKVKIGEYEEALKEGKLESKSSVAGGSVPGTDTVEILGMKLGAITPEHAKQGITGVMVVDRSPLGNAEDAGLNVGDIIRQVNQVSVDTVQKFKAEIEKAIKEAKKSGGKTALLLVSRGNDTIYLPIKLEESTDDVEEAKKEDAKKKSQKQSNDPA